MKLSTMTEAELRQAINEATAIPTHVVGDHGTEAVIITAERYRELLQSHQEHKGLIGDISDFPEIYDQDFK